MEKARACLFIDGRVQGVFYRVFTMELARNLGLKGWVKNLRDGRVEVLFEGEKDVIERAIRECYVGPPGARVSNIDVQWQLYKGDQEEFSIRYL
ncbi:MAG: acylphosphatase [Nitrospirae bacterium]|jgi:acylphosphatase|nr:acylphosphatase [Nitrospirota bacterium]